MFHSVTHLYIYVPVGYKEDNCNKGQKVEVCYIILLLYYIMLRVYNIHVHVFQGRLQDFNIVYAQVKARWARRRPC